MMSTKEEKAKLKAATDEVAKAKKAWEKADKEARQKADAARNAPEGSEKTAADRAAAAAAKVAAAAKADLDRAYEEWKALSGEAGGGGYGHGNPPDPCNPPNPSIPPEPPGGTVCLTFYDSRTLAPMHPTMKSAMMEIMQQDGSAVQCVEINETTEEGKTCYRIDVPPFQAPQPSDDSGDLTPRDIETLCGIPKTGYPMLVLNRLVQPLAIGCQSYNILPVTRDYPSEKEECAPTPVALARLEESYTVGLVAYDTCIGHFLQNSKALVDNVTLELTPVGLSKQAGKPATGVSGKTFSATTKQGYAEVSGLTHSQIHRLRITVPEGYVLTTPLSPSLFNASAPYVQLTAALQPSEFASRSIIFVQKGAPGVRAGKLAVRVGSKDCCTDDNGVLNIPAETPELLVLQSVGRTLSPSSVDLRKDDRLAIIVEVGEPAVAVAGGFHKRRFQHIDEHGEPFSNRRLRVVSSNGFVEIVRTDDAGWFLAEEGALAFADEDEMGHAVEGIPLLTSGR